MKILTVLLELLYVYRGTDGELNQLQGHFTGMRELQKPQTGIIWSIAHVCTATCYQNNAYKCETIAMHPCLFRALNHLSATFTTNRKQTQESLLSFSELFKSTYVTFHFKRPKQGQKLFVLHN